ncbi:MAG: restriction endonuclease subunit S [Clostridia bacterium]
MSERRTLTLGNVCKIKYGKDHKKLNDGDIPVYGSGGIMRFVDTMIHDKKSVLIPRKGTLGNLFLANSPFWTVDTIFWTDVDNSLVETDFLYYMLQTKNLAGMNVGTAVPSLTTTVLNELELSIPPIETQKQIAKILSSFDDKIELNNRINDNLVA